jgi:ribonuclease HII
MPPQARGLWAAERQLQAEGWQHIAGVDEVGRGPLAGPVVAAAVILPPEARLPGLTDSKRLTPEARARLYDLIQEQAIAIGLGQVEVAVIDAINILQATRLAMRLAVSRLALLPQLLLIDGHDPAIPCVPHRSIVGGDGSCACIAAASIIAKVTRDRLMVELDALYPGYGLAQHKGYGTAEHVAQLRALGPCPEHRRSFAPVRDWNRPTLPFGGLDDEIA